jgi:penicillin-binding protein 2
VPTAELKKQLAEEKVISPEDGAGYFVGDNLQLAIGGGLFAASPLQLVNGYSTFANGGDHLEPRVAAAVLAPGTPTSTPGIVDLTQATPTKQFGAVVVNHIDIPQDWQANITRGLVGVIKKNTFPTGTAYKTFVDYGYDSFPIAGKTGTAQAGTNEPQKDSSLFVGFGPIGPGTRPNYTIGAVIERGGFGAEGAAPVVKCLFNAVSGQLPAPLAEPQQSDPLDPNATQAGVIPPLADSSCVKIEQTGVRD